MFRVPLACAVKSRHRVSVSVRKKWLKVFSYFCHQMMINVILFKLRYGQGH